MGSSCTLNAKWQWPCDNIINTEGTKSAGYKQRAISGSTLCWKSDQGPFQWNMLESNSTYGKTNHGTATVRTGRPTMEQQQYVREDQPWNNNSTYGKTNHGTATMLRLWSTNFSVNFAVLWDVVELYLWKVEASTQIHGVIFYSAFRNSLCTYERCWKWCPRASIQAWTRLTFILLMWKIGWAPNNAIKRQMGFNSAFKGLILFANTFCRSDCEMFLMYAVIAVFNSLSVRGRSQYTAA
jgi:hypothetical protein